MHPYRMVVQQRRHRQPEVVGVRLGQFGSVVSHFATDVIAGLLERVPQNFVELIGVGGQRHFEPDTGVLQPTTATIAD